MLYYPRWKQRLWFLFSGLAMLPLLLVGVAFMTLSLNLNGYVCSSSSPIYVHWLAQFAQPVGQRQAYGWCGRRLDVGGASGMEECRGAWLR